MAICARLGSVSGSGPGPSPLRFGQRDRAGGGKGNSAAEHLPQHRAEPPQVRPRTDGLAGELLRRHVAQRADHRAGRRQPLGGVVEHARDAEVDEPSPPVALEQDVAGGHVAVHDPALVGMHERLRHLGRDPRGLSLGSLPARPSRAASDSPSTSSSTIPGLSPLASTS